MTIYFHIHYRVTTGEHMTIQLICHGKEKKLICHSYDNENWIVTWQVTNCHSIQYKYVLVSNKKLKKEHGTFRTLHLPQGQQQIFCFDYWRPTHEPERNFFSAAFKNAIFKRQIPDRPFATQNPKSENNQGQPNTLRIQLYAAAIPRNLVFGIIGNHPKLGEWKKPVLLSDEEYPLWKTELEWEDEHIDLEYKYVGYDPASGKIVEWEKNPNRRLQFEFPAPQGNTLIITNESFKYNTEWRGAGVAIPVFSLRSERGLGIGEFTDLHLLTDWAVKTGLKLIQVLPVNDTIATKTWTDSYPYAAISVFALHPLYVNIQAIAKIKDRKANARLKSILQELNALESLDFERVLATKFEFFRILYQQEKSNFFKDSQALEFIERQAEWLKPYAAFCYLRDRTGTVRFDQWGRYAVFSESIAEEICDPSCKDFDEVAIYYFIQYHAWRQLKAATEYARQNGVVLKGDLPIGIYRYSCDAWTAPHLYNMNGQAGAPPDPYSESGQNWGFPTYNWELMARDNFAWWRKRMTQLADYFDALRIDHILGFFRIWQIPIDQVEGTMGLFNPRIPYSIEELAGFNFQGPLERYTQPYLRKHILQEIFSEDTGFIAAHFLEESQPGIFHFKKIFNTQVKIREYFQNWQDAEKYRHYELPLMRLLGEILLIEEPGSNGKAFNPRITLQNTRSYRELPPAEKSRFDQLYNDYFYKRHDEFWRQQALWKLPPLLEATDMLICGEDLGMIPHSVPGVMRELNILSLEIQRMPKGNELFGNPANYPYTSVCSPSCHDMSTIRGWWEEDYERSQRFYHEMLHLNGDAPIECLPEIVEAINWQHFASPSMWAIFPLQDLVGMDATLRRKDAAAEQINDPAITPHYWRFRFHLPLENLLLQEMLNHKIKNMVKSAGR